MQLWLGCVLSYAKTSISVLSLPKFLTEEGEWRRVFLTVRRQQHPLALGVFPTEGEEDSSDYL